MRRLWTWLGFKDARRPRHFQPQVGHLEGRALQATAITQMTVTPSILNPPDNSLRVVTVAGTIVDSKKGVIPNASYQVIDDYRQIQPLGKITLNQVVPTISTFSFTLTLQAKRVHEYPSGRHYYILVKSADNQNAAGEYKPVIAPLQKLKPGQTTIPSTVQPTLTPKQLKALPPVNVPTAANASGLKSLFGGL